MAQRRLLLGIALLLTGITASAQVQFNKNFGGTSEDQGRSVRQTLDKGYIVAGATSSFGSGGMDIFIVKTDSMGMHQWSKPYGGVNTEWAHSVIQLPSPDSGYVAAGYTNSFGSGGYDVYVMRLNTMGDTLWTRTYGGADWDFGYCIRQTADGGFIIAGTTSSYGGANENIYLVKTNASGDTTWTKTIGGQWEDQGMWVEQTQDLGYIVSGYTNSFGAGNYDLYYMKLDSNGDTVWTKTLGGTEDDRSYCIRETSTGEFVLAGYTESFGYSGSNDFYLVKTFSSGDTIWTQRMGAWDDERAFALDIASDGGYVLAGLTAGPSYHNIYIYKTDMNGYYQLANTPGGADAETAYSVQQTTDGGYIMAGSTNSYGYGLYDFYLVKTDGVGATSPFNSIGEVRSPTPGLSIFPHPVGSSAQLMLPSELKHEKDLSLHIMDITGREVLTKKIGTNTGAILFERGDLEAGIYIYVLSGKNSGMLATGKMIIQ
jgi:hypothetical protein